MRLFSELKSLLVGLWLGSAIFFIGVAQSAFAVIPARETAGEFVSHTLSIVNVSGLSIGLILLGLSVLNRRASSRRKIWLERVLASVLTLSCTIGQFVIALWMSYLKTLMGRPIDEVPISDPLRVQFDSLHQCSVWVLTAGMLAAVILFFVTARSGIAPSDKAFPGTM
jgi:hypothetical protein